jgi:large subunit ribosomal protein L19
MQMTQNNNIVISPVNMENRREIDIKPGDTVKVWQKVEEKGKVRLQPFEGVVLARKHGSEPGATFTVRRVVDGTGVEKIFPLYSPMIDKIEIVRRVTTRRAKLYHIREKAARAIKRQMRKMKLVSIKSESGIEAAAQVEEEKKKAEAEKLQAEEMAQKAEAEMNEAKEAEVTEEQLATTEAKEETEIEKEEQHEDPTEEKEA